MSILKEVESIVLESINKAGYNLEHVSFVKSARSDLGDFQINDAMGLAKAYSKNPREIAEDIKCVLELDSRFTNINIAGPGFINITFTDSFYLDMLKKMQEDLFSNIDLEDKKKILIDFGGANAAKALYISKFNTNL